MTDYSDITQYQQDTITQIWLSLVQYAFLPVSAQIAQTEAKTHIYTPPQALALSAKGTTSVPALVFTGDQRPLIKTSLYIHIYVYQKKFLKLHLHSNILQCTVYKVGEEV